MDVTLACSEGTSIRAHKVSRTESFSGNFDGSGPGEEDNRELCGKFGGGNVRNVT